MRHFAHETDRALKVAAARYAEIKADPTVPFVVRAIEVRMEGGGGRPDISLHIKSGGPTQGGYLFFTDDLEKALAASVGLGPS